MKLRLDMDALAVETFATEVPTTLRDGTVRANSINDTPLLPENGFTISIDGNANCPYRSFWDSCQRTYCRVGHTC